MVQKSILNDKPEILIEKYKSLLRKENILFEKVYLFGSYAKGLAKPWSDIDLCIVSKQFGKNYHDELVRLMKIAAKIEPLIEPHPYHPKDLEDPYDSLAHEIRTSGKLI